MHAVKYLWAKIKKGEGKSKWSSLTSHLEDTSSICELLWEHWLSDGVRSNIIKGLRFPHRERNAGYDDGKMLVSFLGAIHDLGKATPSFQVRARVIDEELGKRLLYLLDMSGIKGMEIRQYSYQDTPHNLAGAFILQRLGVNEGIASIVASHHGKPADDVSWLDKQAQYISNIYQSQDEKSDIYNTWNKIHFKILEQALDRAGYNSVEELPIIDNSVQVLIAGLIIMADWIASNEDFFPLFDIDEPDKEFSIERVKSGFRDWNKSDKWMPEYEASVETLYQNNFGFSTPKDFQKKLANNILEAENPGIIIIEAPMGYGKTEAALAVAQIIAEKKGYNGMFFGLPTQATSDAMFGRVHKWLANQGSEIKSLRLCHGKAYLNEEFVSLATNIYDDTENYKESNVVVNQWFSGKKSAILDDFVVGTVDQFLMIALKKRHLFLKHLGFANKVVILDEVHAYDAYMNEYLLRSIKWMGAYNVPVVILSATLTKEMRNALVKEYLSGKGLRKKDLKIKMQENAGINGYPIITWSDADAINVDTDIICESKNTVSIKKINDLKDGESEFIKSELPKLAKAVINDDSFMGVIVNTVKKAQFIAREIASVVGNENVELLHSSFLDIHRKRKEKDLINLIGKDGARGKGKIVVGTQVLEQSLDIDFDVMVSEIAPMDLLLQRMGRLHRHDRTRNSKYKEATCYIFGMNDDFEFDDGSAAVYGKYLLMQTKMYLPDKINIPDDIPALISCVYDKESDVMANEDCDINYVFNSDIYKKYKKEHDNLVEKKKIKASSFLLDIPRDRKPCLTGFLDRSNEFSDEIAFAQVRDIEDTIEIVVVKKLGEGYTYFDNIDESKDDISGDIMDLDVSKKLLQYTVRLPRAIIGFNIDQTIAELENYRTCNLKGWEESAWLKGSLGLILDKDNTVKIESCVIKYSYEEGITYYYERE